ncbi:MAG TPA: hypothetical protein PK185_09160 [Cyclobacteriaceae bacterium]|nr:hypothetical protein [Cyclobacteriaceae bacterium]HRK54073.1 hypothetical protein [Cyclobacteriaceae bacterium]
MEALNKYKFNKTTALTFASIGLLVQQSIADIGYEITFVICPMLVGDNTDHRQKSTTDYDNDY